MKPREMVVVLLLSASCVRRLPPPARPAEATPQITLPTTPLKEGYGRTVLDVPEGPTNVDLFVGTGRNTFPMFVGGMVFRVSESVDEFRRLCITPCVLDMPSGSHEVKFTLRSDGKRMDRSVVLFDAQPAAYLHVVGRDELNKGRLIGSSVVFALGAAPVLVSPILFAAGESGVGSVMLLGGGAVTAVGSYLLYRSRRTVQPGAGHRFIPAAWQSK